MEFLELGFDDFGVCRDFKVIVGGVIRGTPEGLCIRNYGCT